MATYRYGRWEQWDGFLFYSVDKKTLFGWKEIDWWHYNKEGKRKMLDLVNQLKKLGNIVIEI